jgi:hypothetical protein
MTLFAWPGEPTFEGKTVVTFVSDDEIDRVRNMTKASSTRSTGREKPKLSRLKSTNVLVPGVAHIPATEMWGTTIVVLRTPSEIAAATPLCHRGGSTLWISPDRSYVSGRHVVEAVEPGRWYFVSCHSGSEHIWWDIAEWGGGSGVTIAVARSEHADDDGLIIAAHAMPITLERAAFYSRTYGHDDTLAYAEARELPHEPTSEWKFDPRLLIDGRVADRFGRHGDVVLVGEVGVDRPWSGAARTRKSALTLRAAPVDSPLPADSRPLHGVTFSFVADQTFIEDITLAAKSASGARTSVDVSQPAESAPDVSGAVSLMATPYPPDDLDIRP